jgi:hypothetical protein
VKAISPAEFIINKLGGLTRTARALSTEDRDFPVSTVQGWKDRGRIPQEHWQSLIDAAKEAGIEIDLATFLSVPAEAA